MFANNNFFTTYLIIPILNLLISLYKILLWLRIPGALGFSLILLTVLIRLVLHPLTVKQLESTYKLNKIKPELDKLTEKYKNDKQKLHQEQLKLYQQAGINPAAGCLPLLLQMPILIALYNLFFQLLSNGNLQLVLEGINKVVYHPLLRIDNLELSFLGMNLAHKPSEWQKFGWWLLLIPVITAVLQYWQTKMMIPQTQIQNSKFKIQKEEEKKEGAEDMSTTMQKQMMIMMPLMIGFFAYSFPLGLSLYWNTFTIFGIIEQNQLRKSQAKYDQSITQKN